MSYLVRLFVDMPEFNVFMVAVTSAQGYLVHVYGGPKDDKVSLLSGGNHLGHSFAQASISDFKVDWRRQLESDPGQGHYNCAFRRRRRRSEKVDRVGTFD